MNGITEEVRTPAEHEKTEDVWFQITIDPKNCKRLWVYAESVNSGLATVVREKIMEFSKGLEPLLSLRRAPLGSNEENRP